jgi:hypothetical protein
VPSHRAPQVKAIALGADAVAIGRLAGLALAAGGAEALVCRPRRPRGEASRGPLVTHHKLSTMTNNIPPILTARCGRWTYWQRSSGSAWACAG